MSTPKPRSTFPQAKRVFAVVLCSSVATGAALRPDVASAADKPAASAAQQKTGTAPKADADMQAVLDELAQLGGKPIETLTPAEARKQPTPSDAVMSLLKKQGKDTSPSALVPGVTSVDREIPGAAGNLPARVYTPDGAGPFPVVVYFHGGGWVIGDKQVYDGGARAISKHAQAVVVSVDYRLAPEAKFPAAWDDALAAYKWVAGNAASINGDPKRLALAGESAGGNLAIATAVAALGHKIVDPALAVLVAGEPVLDRRVLDLGILHRDQFDHCSVQLVLIARGCGAAFEVAHIRAFIGDQQRALKLAGLGLVDAEIGRKLHRAAHALGDVAERPIGEDRRVQRRIEVVRHRHD